MSKKYLFILFSLLFYFSYHFASDNRLVLVHADKSTGKLLNGEKIRILEGNVEAYQDTIQMYCDRAIFYEERNRADFIGNVLLDDQHHKLWADKIIYYTDSRIAHCIGNVKISGTNDSLYAEKFIYKFRESNAEGEKNLFIWDKENNARIWGDSGKYYSANRYSIIHGNAKLEQNNPDESDTLIITSKQMEYFGHEPKKAIAIDSVTIFKENIKASCDSAIYSITDETVSLSVKPIVWQQNDEMRGKIIDIDLDSLEVEEIYITDNASIKSLEDSVKNKYNILKGKSIQVTIGEDRKPKQVIARNNASSIYYLEDNDTKQGINSASSDSIIIYFQEGEMDSIIIIGGTEGIFYPDDYKGEIKGEHGI